MDASGGSVFLNLIRPVMLNEIAPPRQLNRYVALDSKVLVKTLVGLLTIIALVGSLRQNTNSSSSKPRKNQRSINHKNHAT